jgi:endonuclease YncB( thermonuclease family)
MSSPRSAAQRRSVLFDAEVPPERYGKTLDVGYAQISVGLAWWFRRYADEQSAEDRGRYASEEEEARLRKRGLWQDANPVPPWEWRKRTGIEAKSQ